LLTHKTVSPAEAALPFAVAARLRAASSSINAQDKVRLLSEALRIDPSLVDSRLGLADATFTLKRTALALAAWESYMTRAQAASAPDAQELSRVRRAAVETLLQQAEYVKAIAMCDQMTEAASEADRAALRKWRARAVRESSLAARNASRRPEITESISQSVVVEPKLTQLPATEIAR